MKKPDPQTTKYGIACHGGPKKRCLAVGNTRYPEELCGSAFYKPDQNVFVLAPLYPYASRKDADADLKKARERRCSMFLPYDGYGKCEIVNDKPEEDTEYELQEAIYGFGGQG